ncbi:Rossmann-fold NAD(P)-binding domain-containing protein [Sulfitobacter guttiformis]|nr:SDR family oxidoreductase [Sulfitobacter guttiformis]
MNTPISPNGARAPSTGSSDPLIPVFLVQESDSFISEDIVAALRAMGPCRVIDVTDVDQIAPVLADEDAVTAAFLEISFEEVLACGIMSALVRCGARIILTTDSSGASDALAAGWGTLARPFNEPMIHEALSAHLVAEHRPKPLSQCAH